MEKRFEVLKFDDCIVLEVLNGHRKIDAWALMLSPKKAVKNKDKTFLAGRIYHWHGPEDYVESSTIDSNRWSFLPCDQQICPACQKDLLPIFELALKTA